MIFDTPLVVVAQVGVVYINTSVDNADLDAGLSTYSKLHVEHSQASFEVIGLKPQSFQY